MCLSQSRPQFNCSLALVLVCTMAGPLTSFIKTFRCQIFPACLTCLLQHLHLSVSGQNLDKTLESSPLLFWVDLKSSNFNSIFSKASTNSIMHLVDGPVSGRSHCHLCHHCSEGNWSFSIISSSIVIPPPWRRWTRWSSRSALQSCSCQSSPRSSGPRSGCCPSGTGAGI